MEIAQILEGLLYDSITSSS